MSATTVHGLIEELARQGVELKAEGGFIRYRGPAAIVERIKPKLIEKKPEILAALTQRVTARVRGKESFEQVYAPDTCWHCQGRKSCGCASCGSGLPGRWQAGVCCACGGTGYLSWGGGVQ